jgi:exodeoxyribonuclease VII large subunit
LDAQAERLKAQGHRLRLALQQRRAGEAQRLQERARRLQALDPQRVLQRGYAWVEAADGRPVLSVRALSAGQAVRAVWADGRARATIEEIERREANEPPSDKRP